jgi:rhamnulokinase
MLLNKHMTEAELYRRTGIIKQPFNTVYQLIALRRDTPEMLENTCDLLLVPEYLTYLLTGERHNEYTNATTTGLVNAVSRDWDDDIITAAGIPRRLFGAISRPCTCAGRFTKAVREFVGFDCAVTLPCTHDTASAVLAAPIDDETLFLSSGTWSLLGAELQKPILTEDSRLGGLTNEGGYGNTYRYLKNIMGLWMIQSIKQEMNDEFTFPELAALAEKNSGFASRIDINDNRFLSPDSMIDEIKSACLEAGQPAPQTVGELALCVYSSLAEYYAETVKKIEKMTNKTYKEIAVIGGGSRDVFLNRLTAEATGKIVTAGPAEATAIGNIAAQMMGEISGIDELRRMIKHERVF